MLQQENTADWQELREQYRLLEQKIDWQQEIADNLLRESMDRKMAGIKRWYCSRYQLNLIAAPILAVTFILQGFHWGFILLMVLVAALGLYFDWKGYRMLDPDRLFGMSFAEASERIARHKHWRARSNWLIALPMMALVGWAILIACDYRWNLPILISLAFLMAVSILWGLSVERRNREKLDEALRQIESLK